MDLELRLDALRRAFDAASIPYALCGGMAMMIHGLVRSTIDIDFLVREEDFPRIEAITDQMGFQFKARPMNFGGGATKIRRVTSVNPVDGETLMLDFLLVTPASEHVWATREKRSWRGSDLWVVSRDGLVSLKQSRSSDQDLVDIKFLRSQS